jgi:hypothetical protein
LDDIITDSNIKGYQLVKSNNKMRLVNKNNIYEFIKKELEKEKFVSIDNKIKNNFNHFKENVLSTIVTTKLSEIPIINVGSTQLELQAQAQAQAQTQAQTGGNINNQLNKLQKYIKRENLTEPDDNKFLNNSRINININDRYQIYNPYLGVNKNVNVLKSNKTSNMYKIKNIMNGGNIPIINRQHALQDIKKGDYISVVSGTKENKSVEEYSKDDMKEDDYETYERNLKYKLFTDEVTDYEETFKDILNAHEAEK